MRHVVINFQANLSLFQYNLDDDDVGIRYKIEHGNNSEPTHQSINMGSINKHARLYDHEWILNQDEVEWIARERMRERWVILKEQWKNGLNQSIVQPIQENTNNYYSHNLNSYFNSNLFVVAHSQFQFQL